MESYQLRRPPKGWSESCADCNDFYVFWQDPEGIWAACGCDAGYIS